ncbi:hypothetical protein [Streptomyces sp. NPDC013489]|uniref:Mu transposase domain-containing protein n=1 Tax=Streptomyces sp. NPDC013489 TaxID=3155606 RepID=UPI0033F23F5E
MAAIGGRGEWLASQRRPTCANGTAAGPAAKGGSAAELNERLAAIDVAEDARHIHGRATSIGFDFEAEREKLRPLPADDYDCGIDLTPTVARNSRITVRQCYYSVPAKFIGTKVRVKLRANEL